METFYKDFSLFFPLTILFCVQYFLSLLVAISQSLPPAANTRHSWGKHLLLTYNYVIRLILERSAIIYHLQMSDANPTN